MASRESFGRWFFARSRKGSRFGQTMTYLILILACVMAIYPVMRVFSVSLRPGDRAISTDMSIIPPDATLENYRNVVMDTHFANWVWNSLVITISTAIIGVLVAMTSAYAFSRWKFKGKGGMLLFLFATQMIPAVMLMIPIYILATRDVLNLVGSWVGLVVAYSVGSVPFSIWILKGYYDTIPIELEEAATIDGCSPMQAYYRIILPLSTPALAIVFLFNFMTAWNDFLLSRIMLKEDLMLTWTQGLRNLAVDQFRTAWGVYSAGALLVAVPVMALFLWSSKWLISGVTLGSVKG